MNPFKSIKNFYGGYFSRGKILLLLLATLMPLHAAIAQYVPEKVNKKAAALYENAMDRAADDQFKEGIVILLEAIRIDPGFLDAYLSIAGMYGEMKNYASANEYYEKANRLDTNYARDFFLPYSINLAGAGRFEDALQAVERFLAIPNLNEKSRRAGEYRRKSYRFAIDYAREKNLGSYHFAPTNLGPTVNSAFSEYFPSITLDAGELVFTRRVNNFNEDFFSTRKIDHNTWDPAKGLVGNINTEQNEGAQNISQDGEWLIFTACNQPDGMGSCDIYISLRTPQGWSTPENLGFPVNSHEWESAPSLSPDKKALYFASRREGGMGGSDIYVSYLRSDGSFSNPENLGPAVNTTGDESCPFIHADNQTLYFTSDGHQGYGGDDLFLVKKGPANAWSEAVNLGYPINTIENEGSLIVAADGFTAYYSSDRSDGYGGLDLYSFVLRNDIRPTRTLWIKGKVFDSKTKKGLPSAVELIDIKTRQQISKLQTDETGHYLITLPVGKDYAFTVSRKGYLFFSENFPLSEIAPDSTYTVDIPLKPIEVNAAVVLNNIFFHSARYDLLPESTTELDKLVQLLKENPSMTIEISGHTDSIGNAEGNRILSLNRAQAVVGYLKEKGISVERLSTKGYGADRPVASNATADGRARNRRTEMKILKD